MCCCVCFVAGATFDQALAGRQAISHTEEFMFDCKISPNHYPSNTVLGSSYKVFRLIYYIWFLPNVAVFILSDIFSPKDKDFVVYSDVTLQT